jgi:hypothetical protein
MRNTLTRDEIIQKCAAAVRREFDFYSDEPLSVIDVAQIAVDLNQHLSTLITTEDWKRHAEERDRRIIEERLG